MALSSSLVRDIDQDDEFISRLRADTVSDITAIDHLDEPISYEEFFQRYLLPNRPCVLGSWATQGWRSRKDWVTGDNGINTQFIKDHFGGSTAPVADCNKEIYSSHPKRDLTVTEYINYLEGNALPGHPSHSQCLYLKDWHFQRDFPTYKAYSTPVYFTSDWLNEFWDKREDISDDYRFVYIGVKGSWTPFHADVFRSYSWSANICGRKCWILFPPGEERNLCDKFGQLAFDLNSSDLEDRNKFPAADRVEKRFEVNQTAGEVIFVPSRWHHQVFNLEDTISINHNWLNGCNVDMSWGYLVSGLRDVEREISDCRDMEGWSKQCQVILKANLGIDYAEFFRFMYTIADPRLQVLQRHLVDRKCTKEDTTLPPGECASKVHPETDKDFPSKQIPDLTESFKGIGADKENNAENKTLVSDITHDKKTSEMCKKHGPEWVGGSKLSLEMAGIHYESYDLNHIIFDLIQIKRVVCDMKTNKEFLGMDLDVLPIRPRRFIEQIDAVLKECECLQ